MGETQSGWRLLSVCDYKWSRQHSDLVIGKVGRWISGGICDQGGGRRAFLDCKRIPTQRKPGSIHSASTSFCYVDFLPFSLLCFVLSPWRGEAGGGGGKVGGGGCLASLAPPIQTSFHLRKVTLIKGPVRLVKMIKGGQKGGG